MPVMCSNQYKHCYDDVRNHSRGLQLVCVSSQAQAYSCARLYRFWGTGNDPRDSLGGTWKGFPYNECTHLNYCFGGPHEQE